MKILIVKTSALGDIVQCFPVLSYLRERFPEGQIDWVVKTPAMPLVAAHPHVDRVFSKKEPLETVYDVAFDLQGNLKSSWVLRKVRAKTKVGFGWKTVPEWPNYFFTKKHFNHPEGKNRRQDYLSVVQQFFGDPHPYHPPPVKLQISEPIPIQAEGKTLVCPGSAWPNKRLPEAKLIEFLKDLDRGPYIFAWGSKEELDLALALSPHFPESEILDRVSLPVLHTVMSRAKLVVAMDSLPLHLCGLTATPSISFFGPSSANKYAPIGAQHTVYQGECPYGVKFEKRCPKLRTCKTGACMQSHKTKLKLR